jgi:cobalt-zinc-cadmium efflux system outer membrane protein
MCLIGITSLLGSIWCGESASANTDARVFHLDDVIELALNRNPTLAAAQGTLEQAQGQRVAAGAYLNPSISGSAGRGAIRDPSTGVAITEHTITVEQPLEWPDKRAARQRAAEAGLASAYAGLEEARLTVVAEVKVAFYQLLLAQQDADLAKQNLRTVQEVADVVQAKVSTGEAARFEGIKATVEVQKARKEVDRSENALVVAQARLDVLTGKALGPGFTIRGKFASVRPGLDRQALIARAVERHPVIRRHQKLVEQAASQVMQERASRIPAVSVQGQYHREAGDESLTAGLSVPIPIWYRRQGEIGMVLGAQRRAEAERLRVQNELEQAVTQHAQEVQTAHGQIRVFEEGLLKQAKEALDIAQFSFQHGTASLLEVLDAQRVYRQTLIEYAQARADLSIALSRLDRATGDLP